MQLIIFEGIASSGKTTIEKLLLSRLPNSSIVSEEDTLMPLIDNKDMIVAQRHLKSLIDSLQDESLEFLILDRFHFTHAFRTESSLAHFSDIESRLERLGDVLVVLLTIKEENIRERIEETMRYRKGGWNKGGQGASTINEKITYYTEQQNKLLSLQKESRLPCIVIDTSEKHWNEYVEQIVKKLT